jgi:uncharacterized lipoprotein YmbA
MRALAALVLAGCALTSRAAPRELRYFTAEAPTPAATQTAPRAQLRLGRISASANLRYAIVRRTSAVEVTPYETLRWTELPDAYVRRALDRALFDERPLTQVVSGDAPTLEVEVIAFEETARHGGLVTLRYELRDDRSVIARGTVSAERPAGSPAIEAVVEAIRAAMIAATEDLAGRVEGALLQRAAPAPTDTGSPAAPQASALH